MHHDAPRSVQLGSVSHEYGGTVYRHGIYAWRDYGVVAPGLVTTNGSDLTLAEALCSRDYLVREWDPRWEHLFSLAATADPADSADSVLGDIEALREALVRAYREAMAAEGIP